MHRTGTTSVSTRCLGGRWLDLKTCNLKAQAWAEASNASLPHTEVIRGGLHGH